MNNTSAVVFVDLLLGNVRLPIFTYHVGFEFRLWTRWIWTEKTNKPLYTFLMIFDTFLSQASLTSAAFISRETFNVIYWPVKHRSLSKRLHGITIFAVWILALLISATWTASNLLLSHSMFIWGPYNLLPSFIRGRHLFKIQFISCKQ